MFRKVVLNLSWFVVLRNLPKTLNTCGPLLINKNTYLRCGFCNIAAELFNKGLWSWPPENRSVDP